LRNIHEQLRPGGVLIVIEKILAEETDFNRDFIKYYYNHKRRNNYSEMEISQKREALENVLIPYKLSENITLLKEVGFRTVEVFFKWYNFSGFIAKKQS
jgi:tRNA (cmo5U34)-methyltransferase